MSIIRGRPTEYPAKSVLLWMKSYHDEFGWMPSYAEIADHFEMSAKRTAMLKIDELVEAGYLNKGRGARAYSFTKSGIGWCYRNKNPDGAAA